MGLRGRLQQNRKIGENETQEAIVVTEIAMRWQCG